MVYIIIILIIVIITIFNYLINLKNKVKRSKSLIDVYLQKRFDLIPNLVEVVKKYGEYEQETLRKVVSLKEEFGTNKDLNIANEINNQIDMLIGRIEGYPSIKADEQYKILQKNLVKIEDELQASRRIYNMDVTKYNTKIAQFPNNLVAKILNFKEEKLFEAKVED